MRRTPALLTALFFLFISPALSQTKRLSLEQSLGRSASLTKPINSIRGWADGDHYIEYDAHDGQTYQVHVKSGKRSPYVPPPSSDVEVVLKDRDLYLRRGDAPLRRLTHSPEVEEMNPTLSPRSEERRVGEVRTCPEAN